jgi:hypothetical protein
MIEKNKITLINYEGAALWAVVNDSGFAIYDQWNELLEVLSLEDFCSFLDGDLEIRDSKEHVWIYTKESQYAKPKSIHLYAFLSSYVIT